ncbi:hypothetical protein B0T16DRAFT_404609 [Cercophora newfieldiana]|uniref:Uncharacterized protein n=1 Tax=Cercophora newfieldiana TaxID=92897 RepID=A0AA40CU93_9PEZI|nr:hypothetical protein B0T16DRAFT_404609 [Cercophora newfieldiana]
MSRPHVPAHANVSTTPQSLGLGALQEKAIAPPPGPVLHDAHGPEVYRILAPSLELHAIGTHSYRRRPAPAPRVCLHRQQVGHLRLHPSRVQGCRVSRSYPATTPPRRHAIAGLKKKPTLPGRKRRAREHRKGARLPRKKRASASVTPHTTPSRRRHPHLSLDDKQIPHSLPLRWHVLWQRSVTRK